MIICEKTIVNIATVRYAEQLLLSASMKLH